MRIASRLAEIKPSATLATGARAARLRAEGIDVIGFGAGEPDFDTPTHIKDAAKRALDAGQTKLTEVAGTLALRKAVCREIEKAHGLQFPPEQVQVASGAKQSLYNVFQALLDEGDEVIIPAPYWVSYPDMVKLASGHPVYIETSSDAGFRVTPAQLREAITPKTRAFVLNSPSNPTGSGYPRAELAGLAEVLADHPNVLVVSDDIYRKLIYGDYQFHQIASVSPALAERTVIVDGMSKTYSMTGWRIGFALGPKALIGAMNTLQGQSTSSPTSIAQAAALAALEGPQDCVEDMRVKFDERRQKIVSMLRAIPGVRCFDPQGAFYAFPELSAYIGRRPKGGAPLVDDLAIVDYLLDVGRIAVVPGSGFGAPGFARLSYAMAMENIVRGVERMAEALAKLE